MPEYIRIHLSRLDAMLDEPIEAYQDIDDSLTELMEIANVTR